jgi:Rrf2 family protein
MMISTRGRYALRMMVDLADHQGNGYVSLKDIAERQEISKKYLEQIIPVLNSAQFLQTTRGFQGGYRLSRAPKDYTMAEILQATEGTLVPVSCLDGTENSCARQAACATLPVWEGLSKVVKDYLNGITLQDVLDDLHRRTGGDYVI